MNGIKIDPRFKGEWHYEMYLIPILRKEVMRYVFEMNYERELKILIGRLFDAAVDKENIIQIYTHTPNEIVHHLCYGTLYKMYRNTSTKVF
jgi:hypothetical protein